MEEKTMTVEQVADYLHVSRRTVYNYLATGRLQGGKVGRRWIFRLEDVEKLITPDMATTNH